MHRLQAARGLLPFPAWWVIETATVQDLELGCRKLLPARLLTDVSRQSSLHMCWPLLCAVAEAAASCVCSTLLSPRASCTPAAGSWRGSADLPLVQMTVAHPDGLQVDWAVEEMLSNTSGPDKVVAVLDARGASTLQVTRHIQLFKETAVALNQV